MVKNGDSLFMIDNGDFHGDFHGEDFYGIARGKYQNRSKVWFQGLDL